MRWLAPALLLALLLLPSTGHAQTAFGDPCEVMPKSVAAVAISTAVTTSLIAPVAGQAIYICGLNLVMGSGTSIQFQYGTGALCATGNNAISGIIPTAQITTPTMNATQMVTPVSQRLCALSTGTNGIHGSIVYVQW